MNKKSTDKQSENKDTARARSLANLKPFKPGQSGNPAGRPKSITISEAYRRELAKLDPDDKHGRTFAEVLAEQIIIKAKGGDVQAVREHTDEIEERAAIMEYDGGLLKERAETMAIDWARYEFMPLPF